MPNTGSGLFPYPNASAVPDVPADILLLAQRIDLMASGWTMTANATTRAALVTNGNAYEGLHVYQIDTAVEYIYRSAAWVAWNSDWITWATAPSNLVVGTGGSASSLQRYKWVDGRLWFDYKFVLGTTGSSMGTNPALNLPLNIVQTVPAVNIAAIGKGAVYDLSALSAPAITEVLIQSATKAEVHSYSAGAYGTITAAAPMTWASGDILAGGFWADAA